MKPNFRMVAVLSLLIKCIDILYTMLYYKYQNLLYTYCLECVLHTNLAKIWAIDVLIHNTWTA